MTTEERIKQHARGLGFDLVGIAPAAEADGFDRLVEWLDRGYAGEMEYLRRQAEARRHPASILPAVRSVVMLGFNYNHRLPEPDDPGRLGKVARYAHGPDYHHVLWDRLNRLRDLVRAEIPGCDGRGVVDTAPLLERDFGRRAGLGWFGKNTMLINTHLGSFFFLAALLLDREVTPDSPHRTDHCGTCTRCLDACPTGAFVGPRRLDATKCISYLTIELKTDVPDPLKGRLDGWVFGCDVCQDVCPWNRKAPEAADPVFGSRRDLIGLDPAELLQLTDEGFRLLFRGTAVMRAKRRGLLRSAALALGTAGNRAHLPALRNAARDPDPVIAAAAAWAVGEIVAAGRET